MSRRIGKIIFMILLCGIVFSQGEELRPPTADRSLLIWVQRVCDEAEEGMVAPAYEVRLGGQPHPVDLVEPFPLSAPVMVALLTAELQPDDWPVLTRWLEQVVRELSARSVPVWGAWREPAIALASPAVVRTALADARQEAETAMLDVPRPASAILDDIRRQVETACPPWQPATVLVIGRDSPGPPSEIDLYRPALTDALVAVMTRRCVGVYGLLLGEAAGPLSRALPTLAATPVGLAEEDGRRVARRILRDREQQRVLTIPYPADLVGARSHELVVTEVTTACRCRSRAVLWLVPPDLSVPNRTDLERAAELRRTLGSESSSSDIMGQIVTATEIVRLSPFTVGDRLHLARLHARLNSWPEVQAVLTQAQQLFPQSAAIYAEWGRVHEQTAETTAARQAYEQALAREDDLPEIRRELARLYQADGETERAVAQLERLVGSAVDGPEVRLELAAGYAALGKPDEAIQAARVAVEQSGGAATSRLYLAELYLQQTRWPDVLALLPAPTTDSRHDARWDRVAGLAHIGLTQYSTARPYLKRAVEATPEDIPLQQALAQAYRQEGLWPEAAEVLARLVSLPDVPPDVHLELAAVYQESGAFMAAGAVLVAAAERWPDEPDIWRALGTWAERRGDLAQAITAMKRLVTLSPAEDRSAIQDRLAYLHLLQGASLATAAHHLAQAGRTADADRLSALAAAGDAAQSNVPPASERLRLPGGVAPLFRFAPFLENRPRDEIFLRLLFEYILDGDPLDSGKNPRQAEWVSFLESYVEFQEWLKKKNLYQPTLTLRFSADKAVLKQTNRILSFFDVSIKRKNKKGKVVLEANLGQGDNDLRRRKVLEFVGFNPNVVRVDSEFTFQFEADTLPVLLGPSFWLENVLDKKPHQAPELLRWWLEKPAAMKLYVALSRIPQPAAEWFQRHIRPDRLPGKIMPGLYAFGAMLKFEPDGRLWLPGGETGVSRWERLIGESLTAKPDKFIEKVFTKNNGRAIYFLAALSQAPPEVSGYLMASEERFKRFYNTVEEPGEDFQSGKYFRKYHDFGDLLVLLEMDDDGIAFPGSPQLWLLAAKHGFSTQSFSKLHKLLRRKVKFKGEGDMLHNLLDKAREGTALKGVRKYAVLTYLSETMPELMADEMGIAMELLFDRFGPQYQIIAEIEMDPQLTRRFFALLERLDKLGDDSRRTNILLFQGTLGLIQLLNRQDAMTDAVARQLCQQFFDRLGSVGDPGVVAMATASFLREDVATALGLGVESGATTEPGMTAALADGLAGERRVHPLRWDGDLLEVDIHSQAREKILNFVEYQRLPALDPLLTAYGALAELPQHADALPALLSACSSLREVDLGKKPPDELKEAVLHTDRKRLVSRLNKLKEAVTDQKTDRVAKHAAEVATELAPFLAESLAGLVYGAEILEEDVVGSVDEHFVRKHEFSDIALQLGLRGPQTMGGYWGQPKVVQDPVLGAHLQGSLSGISMALAELYCQSIVGESTTYYDPAFPYMQKVSVDLMNPSNVSSGGLEYLALHQELASRLLALAVLDESVRNQIDTFNFEYLGARRANRVQAFLRKGQVLAARAEYLPSELVWLGAAWISEMANPPPLVGDLIVRLQRFDDLELATELDEFGFPGFTWYGVECLRLEQRIPIETASIYQSSYRLAERSCELKLHLARLFWQMGLPADLFKTVANRLVDEVVIRISQASARDWLALRQAVASIQESDVVEILQEFRKE